MKVTNQTLKNPESTNNISDIPEGTIEERYRALDTQRQSKLTRARKCAARTLPDHRSCGRS